MDEKLNKVTKSRKQRKIRRQNDKYLKYLMDVGIALAEKSKDPRFNRIIKKLTRY